MIRSTAAWCSIWPKPESTSTRAPGTAAASRIAWCPGETTVSRSLEVRTPNAIENGPVAAGRFWRFSFIFRILSERADQKSRRRCNKSSMQRERQSNRRPHLSARLREREAAKSADNGGRAFPLPGNKRNKRFAARLTRRSGSGKCWFRPACRVYAERLAQRRFSWRAVTLSCLEPVSSAPRSRFISSSAGSP